MVPVYTDENPIVVNALAERDRVDWVTLPQPARATE